MYILDCRIFRRRSSQNLTIFYLYRLKHQHGSNIHVFGIEFDVVISVLEKTKIRNISEWKCSFVSEKFLTFPISIFFILLFHLIITFSFFLYYSRL